MKKQEEMIVEDIVRAASSARPHEQRVALMFEMFFDDVIQMR